MVDSEIRHWLRQLQASPDDQKVHQHLLSTALREGYFEELLSLLSDQDFYRLIDKQMLSFGNNVSDRASQN